MTKEDKLLLSESIAHWKRIIKWVKTQPPENSCDIDTMQMENAEDWGAENCPICLEYWDCKDCLLYKNNMRCAPAESLFKRRSE